MDSEISSKSNYIIRYYFGINEEMDGIIQYINDNCENKNIGILYGNVAAWENVINKKLIPFLSNKKIKLSFKETYDIKQNDFNSISLKLKNANIDFLILLGYGFEYDKIFKGFVDNRLLNDFKIIGGWGFLYTNLPNSLTDGICVSGPQYVFESKEEDNKFKTLYYNAYKSYPNFDAAFAYEAICEISKIKKGINLKEYFKNKTIKSDVIGEYKFDSIGNLIVKTNLGMIKNGIIKNIEIKNK